jgi:hypothetical protein
MRSWDGPDFFPGQDSGQPLGFLGADAVDGAGVYFEDFLVEEQQGG